MESSETAEPDAEPMTAVLDGIPGAWERAETGRRQSEDGDTVALEDL